MNTKRHGIVTAVYLIARKEGKILLSKRQNTGYMDGYYSFVSGHVEEAESITQALKRESLEEANIVLNENDAKLVHTMNRKSDDYDRLDFFFELTRWEGQIKNREPDKCASLEWFDQHALPKNSIPEVRHALTCIQNTIAYSELNY